MVDTRKKNKAAQVNDESKVAQVSKRRLLSNCLWPTLAAKITFLKKRDTPTISGDFGTCHVPFSVSPIYL